MTGDHTPVVNPSVLLREEFDDWAILFDPDTCKGFGLNPTGVYLWKLLDGERTLDALLQKIREDADDVPGNAAGQIRAFVDALIAQGLAGFQWTALGQRTQSLPPQAVLTGLRSFPYDPPKLVEFFMRPAVGMCQNGSNAAGTCDTGSLATATCHPTGNAAESNCNTGFSKAGPCANGGTPQPGACSVGSAP